MFLSIYSKMYIQFLGSANILNYIYDKWKVVLKKKFAEQNFVI